MSGIIGDNVGRSGGLIKAVTAAAGSEWTSLSTTTFTSDASTFDYEPGWFNAAYDYKLVRLTFLNIHPDTNNSELYMRYKRCNDAGSIDGSYQTSGYYQGGKKWSYSGEGVRNADNAGFNFFFDPNSGDGVGDEKILSRMEMFVYYGGKTAETGGSLEMVTMTWWQTTGDNASGKGGQVLAHAHIPYGLHGIQIYSSGGGGMNGDTGATVYAHYNNVLGSF